VSAYRQRRQEDDLNKQAPESAPSSKQEEGSVRVHQIDKEGSHGVCTGNKTVSGYRVRPIELTKCKSTIKAQECSERMSASVSSNTSFNSRRSAGNSRSDGRSNYRSDRANPHGEFHGIKFVFGRPDQVPIYLQSMKKLGGYAGTKMNNNMYKLVKKKVEAMFPKPKAPDKDPAKHVVDECRELMKRKWDKEDNHLSCRSVSTSSTL